MKNLSYILLFLFLNVLNLQSNGNVEYRSHFREDYQEAIQFIETKMPVFQVFFREDPEAFRLMIPVVFPEIVRFSMIRNLAESAGLHLLYVPLGAKHSDFSVGRFQMKPSFIERLENYVKTKDFSNWKFITRYSNINPKEIRKERLERLRSLKWQLNYLYCFYDIMVYRFPFIEKLKEKDKLAFLASAYNTGFHKSKNEIISNIKSRYYPYGARYPGNQISYIKLSEDFYLSYWIKKMKVYCK